MKDITEILNSIIIKYDLDSYYPNFRKRLQAEAILRNFFQEGSKRIACVAAFPKDIKLMRHFSGHDPRIDYFLCERTHDYHEDYNTALDVTALVEVDWQQYDAVLVASLEGSIFLKRWLRQHGVRHLFLYDLFALQGIIFDKDWDSLLTDSEMGEWTYHWGKETKRNYIIVELLEEIHAYHAASTPEIGILHLHKSYFLALYIKDFILAAKCVAYMHDDTSKQQLRAWAEIKELLAEIKSKLNNIDRKDILLLWSDEVPYEDIEKIPYLKHKMMEGITFDNLFTVCPSTNPTLKAILCGKLPVTDDTYSIKEITDENSPVYRLLKNHGYGICVIGSWPAIRGEEKSTAFHMLADPASLCLWDLWRNILQSEKKMFYLVHSLAESHGPNLSAILSDEEIGNGVERFHKSCAYLSEQYNYYLSIISKKMMRFFMTDHGWDKYKTFFHAYLVIEGEGIQPRHIDGMCSFVDFHRILEQILVANKIKEDITREYVEVQELDLYNADIIARMIVHRKDFYKLSFGYHGVITAEYIYLQFTDGREWFVRRNMEEPEPNLFESYMCDEEQAAPFRMIVRKKQGNMPSFINKLKYAQYLHEIFIRAKARNNRKKAILEGWLSQYPAGSVLIRTGGWQALQFYEMLSQEGKRCIGGIIDTNPQCLCASLPKPLYTSLAEAPYTFKAILLGSKDLIAMLREEAAPYSDKFDILDPYQFLAEHGIICRNGAGAFEPAEEDYEVGFPFDEVNY